MTRATPLAMALAFAALAGTAQADTDIRTSGKFEAMLTTYGKDYYDCWNDGLASCRRKPTQIEGENYLRADGVTELGEDTDLIYRGQLSAYANSAWYTRSSAVPSQVGYEKPSLHTELEDSWIGLRDQRFGTLRLGRGLNPWVQALQGDGTTDHGGREMLELAVMYDSPVLIGEKSHGVSFSYAHYKGTHMRKEIRVYAQGEDDSRTKVKPEGDALLIDGTWMGKFNFKVSGYREGYAARQYPETGPLDSDPSGLPGTGALTHSKGAAVLASYEFPSFRLGASLSENRRDQVVMVNPAFPSVGYKSQVLTAFLGAWHGPWNLWGRVEQAKFGLQGDALNAGSDWIYSNFTIDYLQAGGEISYEFVKNSRVVVGYDWKRKDFKEAPTANGMCATGKSRECYDPKGFKVFAGLRSNF